MTLQVNNQTGEVIQQGSLTRVDHYQAPSSPLQTSAPEPTTVGNSLQRITYREGEMTTEQMGVSRYQAGQPEPGNKSVMATFQRIRGMETVELSPGDPTSRTVVPMALKLGLIEDLGGGRYRDARRPFEHAPSAVAAAETEQVVEQQQQAHQEFAGPDEGFFNAEEDKAYAQDIADIPQGAYDSAVALATVASLDGTDLSKVEERLSKQAGMARETAAQLVGAAYDMYRETVVRAMVPEGISVDQAPAFFAYCRTRPRELQNAIGKLTAGRDLSGFRQLATLYRGTMRGRE